MGYTDKQSKSGPTSTSQGIQCSHFGYTNRSYLKDGQRSRCHFFKMPMNNPLKNIWCNHIGKMDGKDGFVVRKNSKVCHMHFVTEDILRVPGGKRWRLSDGAVPIKAGQPPKPCRKRNPPPPPVKHDIPEKVKANNLNKSNTDEIVVYQPKSLLSCALAAVSKVYKSMVDENKKMKCKLKTVEQELNESRNKLQQETFGIEIIKNSDELCRHYTGFPDFERLNSCLSNLSVGVNGQNVMMQRSTEIIGNIPNFK